MAEGHKTPRQIFSEALAKQTAEEQSRYLAEACGSNIHLRSRLEALLKANEEVDDFLEIPALQCDGHPTRWHARAQGHRFRYCQGHPSAPHREDRVHALCPHHRHAGLYEPGAGRTQ